jgi:hypothetical protein
MRLVIVDISDPTAPRFLGQSDILPGQVKAVAVQDNLAFVETGGALFLYDISDPAVPVRVGTLTILAGDQLSKSDIILAGEFVYVLRRLVYPEGASLIAIDVSDPTQPVEVERRDLAVTAAVTASSSVLYIVNEGKLQLVDAANPDHTFGESALEFRLSHSYWRYFVTVMGDLAFVGVSEQPLQVWDVSNPAQPARVPAGQLELPPSNIALKAAGETLFLVDMSQGECNFIVRVIDIADVASLRYTAESEQFNCILDMALGGDNVVAATEGGFQIFDHSDPARLPAVGSFTHPAGFDMVYNVTLNQNLAYIILGHGEATRLAVLDRTRPTAPVMVGEPLGLAVRQGCGVEALYVREDRLYVVPGCSPMLTVDISKPIEPVLIENEGEAIEHWLTVPALNGTVIYAPVPNGLGVFDMSDPANPILFSTLPWDAGISHLSISDRYLIVKAYSSTIWVLYDLNDPLRPVEVGRLEGEFRAYAVAGNTFFYVSSDTNSLVALDLADPVHSSEIGRLDLPFHPHELVPVEDTLYLSIGGGEWAEGIWAVNVSDAAHPYLEWNLPLRINDFGVDGNLMYLSAGEAGLLVLQIEK